MSNGLLLDFFSLTPVANRNRMNRIMGKDLFTNAPIAPTGRTVARKLQGPDLVARRFSNFLQSQGKLNSDIKSSKLVGKVASTNTGGPRKLQPKSKLSETTSVVPPAAQLEEEEPQSIAVEVEVAVPAESEPQETEATKPLPVLQQTVTETTVEVAKRTNQSASIQKATSTPPPPIPEAVLPKEEQQPQATYTAPTPPPVQVKELWDDKPLLIPVISDVVKVIEERRSAGVRKDENAAVEYIAEDQRRLNSLESNSNPSLIKESLGDCHNIREFLVTSLCKLKAWELEEQQTLQLLDDIPGIRSLQVMLTLKMLFECRDQLFLRISW